MLEYDESDDVDAALGDDGHNDNDNDKNVNKIKSDLTVARLCLVINMKS